MLNVPDHLKLSDIQFDDKLCGYRSDGRSCQDAKRYKAIHYTHASQDALNFTEGKSGFYDLLEVVELIQNITNHSDTTMGIEVNIPDGHVFIALEFIFAIFFKWGDDASLTDIVNIAIESHRSEHYAREHFPAHIYIDIPNLISMYS